MSLKNKYFYFIVVEIFLVLILAYQRLWTLPISIDDAQALYKCCNNHLLKSIGIFFNYGHYFLGQQPLFYLIGSAIAKITKNMIILRLYPFLTWILGAIYFFKLLKKISPNINHHIALIFYLTHPYLYYYNTYFNRYSLFAALIVINFYYFFTKSSKAYWMTSIFLIFTHVYGFLIIFCHFVWRFSEKKSIKTIFVYFSLFCGTMYFSFSTFVARLKSGAPTPQFYATFKNLYILFKEMNFIPFLAVFFLIGMVFFLLPLKDRKYSKDFLDIKNYFLIQLFVTIGIAFIFSSITKCEFSIRDLLLINFPFFLAIISLKFSENKWSKYFFIIAIMINVLSFRTIFWNFEEYSLRTCEKMNNSSKIIVAKIENKKTVINLSSIVNYQEWIYFISYQLRKKFFNYKNKVLFTLTPDIYVPYGNNYERLIILSENGKIPQKMKKNIHNYNYKFIDKKYLGIFFKPTDDKFNVCMSVYDIPEGLLKKYSHYFILYDLLKNKLKNIYKIEKIMPCTIEDILKIIFSKKGKTRWKPESIDKLDVYKTSNKIELDGKKDSYYKIRKVSSPFYNNLKWGALYDRKYLYLILSFFQETPILLSSKFIMWQKTPWKNARAEYNKFFNIEDIIQIDNSAFLRVFLYWKMQKNGYFNAWKWEPGILQPYMVNENYFFDELNTENMLNTKNLNQYEVEVSKSKLYKIKILDNSENDGCNVKLPWNKFSRRFIGYFIPAHNIKPSDISVSINYNGKKFEFKDALKNNGCGFWQIEIKRPLRTLNKYDIQFDLNRKRNYRLYCPYMFIPEISPLYSRYAKINSKKIGMQDYYEVIFKK